MPRRLAILGVGSALIVGMLPASPALGAKHSPLVTSLMRSPKLAAKAVERDNGPFPSTGFVLRSSNGYKLFVVGFPDETVAHHAVVGLKAEGPGNLSNYVVRGTVGRRTIKAKIGDLGSIDMTFHPDHRIGHYRPPCHHRHHKVKLGTWRGTVSFTGEGGYTSVSATRARPTWLYAPESCGGASVGPHTNGAWLNNSGRSFFFEAYQNRGPGTTTRFDAAEFESTPGMGIIRVVWTKGSPRAFTYNRHLTKATVKPPAPFDGKATFAGHHGNGQLSGSLSASFVGGPTVSLAGSRTKAYIQYARIWNVF